MNKIATGLRVKIYLLVILAAAHILITLFCVVPGHYSIDEIIYHWSVRDFAASGQLSVWNGYEEHPSPELVHPFLAPHSGRLHTQYPMVFSVMAAPFYKLWGYYGLFLLNSIAFLMTLGFCLATARRLFDDVDLAVNSCLILALGTFFWEYSQAAWPHMTSACFATGALYLMVCAYLSDSKSYAACAAAGAGILAGIGPGLRFDGLFVIPALILPLMVSRRSRVVELAAFSLGTLPGLLFTSYLNYLRFGTFTPITDGHGFQITPYVMAYPLVIASLAWGLHKAGLVDRALKRKTRCLQAIIGAALVALFVPAVRSHVVEWLHYTHINVIDITAFDENFIRPAMSRSEGGGVVYIGAHKKALLQSAPFLALLIVPLINLFRKPEDTGKLSILFLLPIMYFAGYAYTFNLGTTLEGGLCLNLRYFVPILPPLAILCAYAIRNLREERQVRFSPAILAISGLVTVFSYWRLVEKFKTQVNELVFPLLILPLLLAFFLGCLLLLRIAMKERLASADGIIAALLAAAFTWSGLVAIFYDYHIDRNQRINNYILSRTAMGAVPPDSLFFTAPYVDAFMGLLDQPKVRIAFPAIYHFQDFKELLQYHSEQGRRCFAVFPAELWDQLRTGPLMNYTVKPLVEFAGGAFLGEISPASGSQAPSGK
jgi:hypothetical protein